MPDLLHNPHHWRERAAEARAQAEETRTEEARRAMLILAEECDNLAKIAEEYVRRTIKPR